MLSFIPSFIFCEFQLVYCADFYKWRPMRDGKILWKIVDRSMWFDVSFDLFLYCWHFWVVLMLTLLSLRLCFDSICLTEVMAEEVLSKLRGTRKVYSLHIENSSKEFNDILETFLPDSNFDTIIRLNTLTTSILNKIDKRTWWTIIIATKWKGLGKRAGSNSYSSIFTSKNLIQLFLSKIDLHLSKPTKNAELNMSSNFRNSWSSFTKIRNPEIWRRWYQLE